MEIEVLPGNFLLLLFLSTAKMSGQVLGLHIPTAVVVPRGKGGGCSEILPDSVYLYEKWRRQTVIPTSPTVPGIEVLAGR